MESEIPVALLLLRHVSRSWLEGIEIEYWRFLASVLFRLVIGYLFLINVVVILIQADAVIDMFYGGIAMRFIQSLDDLAYTLYKYEVFAIKPSESPFFSEHFEKREGRSNADQSILQSIKWKTMTLLKGAYIINFIGFLAVIITINYRQSTEFYQCSSVTVEFELDVWEKAVVMSDNVIKEEMFLVYSYFNGQYAFQGETNEGRPVYVEQKKIGGRNSFDLDPSPVGGPSNVSVDPIVPAEIRYCNGRWIFTHRDLRKSRLGLDSDQCNWLLRSEATNTYDLLEVSPRWQIWAGDIKQTTMSISCDECKDNVDCNLNGICNNGECECFSEKNVTYLGTHCDIEVVEECRTIVSDRGDRWSLDAKASFTTPGKLFQNFGRPSYIYLDGLPPDIIQQPYDDVILYPPHEDDVHT